MSIEIEQLTKRYDGTPVVDDVSLSIATGELFVLLGPSGSGKSTLLRMIAGLTEIEEGRVALHGRDVTGVSPKDRGIGFVFQHYALFRHMTVADNVEFALKVRKVRAVERRRRREELLQLVGLSGFGGRYPRQLSGGQQQRVALARALAHEPNVLLLDEPFGALDAKIRLELRHALRRIQREVGLTTVFVTHDQEEAFELADRLAVLHDGRLLEVGEPRELYLRPRSPFVATFLGAANLVVGESSPRAVRLGAVELPVASELATGRAPRRVQVLFRPEDIELSDSEQGEHPRLGRGKVEERSFVGAFERLRIRVPALSGVRGVAPAMSWGGRGLLFDAIRPQHESASLPLKTGADAWVAVRRFHVLAPASLRLLVESGVSPSTPAARAARELGEAMAARLGAHLTLLDGAPRRSTATRGDRDAASPGTLSGAVAQQVDNGPELSPLGAATARGAEGFDIAVLALEPERLPGRLVDLRLARHHLLLVSQPAIVPSRLLVCVAVGEPGKGDVQFAERVAWQLGAEATVLTVLPPENGDGDSVPPHVERFLEACRRTLGARGVVSQSRVRRGPVLREILAEVEEGEHDLLVIGAPLPASARRPAGLRGLVDRLLRHPPACPVMVVRYRSGE
ncbi:MAG: ATP-binding cassette domain-containing protein [Thermoanaerobaculia bacterium]